MAADLSFLVNFYGLTLFAAGGLNMVASTTAADAFSTFRFFSASWQLISSSNSDRVSSCASQLRVAAQGAVIGDAQFVKTAKQVEVDAGDEAVFELGIGEAVPLSEQDGF